MCQNILDQIPPTLLQRVRRHLEVIHDFNAEVLRARDLERRVGSPGRYAWALRLARAPQAQASIAWLARFAAQAATRGITAQDVYDHLGWSPTPLPCSTAAQEWLPLSARRQPCMDANAPAHEVAAPERNGSMSRSSRSSSASDQQLGLFPPAHQPLLVGEERPPYALAIYRVTLVREASVQVPSTQIRTAHDAAALFRPYLAGVDREHFVVVLLNRKHHAIGLNTVSIGSLKASIVGVREVFKPAILANADAIICAHNHPSGAPRSA